uniref:Receptor for retinol uptake STRA6 n=1 Tax=Plectus sambesii TaxID=2011161 RepID=A0A914XJM5_9BILA
MDSDFDAALQNTNNSSIKENETRCDFNTLFETESDMAWYNLIAFYIQILLSILIIIQYAFQSRGGKFIDACMHWRAAVPIPVNMTETRRDRGIIIAAFGFTTIISIQIVTGEKILPYSYSAQVRAIFVMLECILVGFCFWPVFAVITTKSLFGLIIGSVYVWLFSISHVIFGIPCQSVNSHDLVISVLSNLPVFIFALWIGVGVLYRTLTVLWYAKSKRKFSYKVANSVDGMDYHVKHVKSVLRKHKKSTMDNEDSTGWRRLRDYFYTPISGFRYSVNILAAAVMTETIVYMVMIVLIDAYTKQIIRQGPKFVSEAQRSLQMGIENKTVLSSGNLNLTAGQVFSPQLYFAEFFVTYSNVPVYTSFALAFLISILCMLLTLKNYRRNLLGFYRGERYGLMKLTHNPVFNLPAIEILGQSAKFVGYQVAYGTYAFIFQFFTLAIILCAVWFAFILIVVMGQWHLLLTVLASIWPTLAFVFFTVIAQVILCNLFLQKGGDSLANRPLALDNRHFFFNFQYFMVYVNAPLGLLACLGRLLQSMFFGLWTLSRLDMSTMSRTYEATDSGYLAYICLLTMENAQSNPTMNVFVQILLKSIEETRRYPPANRRRKLVINRWKLLFTLSNNPKLIKLRSESLLSKNFNGCAAGKTNQVEMGQTTIEGF